MWWPCCSIDEVPASSGSQNKDKTLVQCSKPCHKGEFWHVSISAWHTMWTMCVWYMWCYSLRDAALRFHIFSDFIGCVDKSSSTFLAFFVGGSASVANFNLKGSEAVLVFRNMVPFWYLNLICRAGNPGKFARCVAFGLLYPASTTLQNWTLPCSPASLREDSTSLLWSVAVSSSNCQNIVDWLLFYQCNSFQKCYSTTKPVLLLCEVYKVSWWLDFCEFIDNTSCISITVENFRHFDPVRVLILTKYLSFTRRISIIILTTQDWRKQLSVNCSCGFLLL